MGKKLYKGTDKMICGVASGLADYFDMDISLVRVIIVLICFIGGTGVLAYIILALVLPEKPVIKPTNVIKNEDGKDDFEI